MYCSYRAVLVVPFLVLSIYCPAGQRPVTDAVISFFSGEVSVRPSDGNGEPLFLGMTLEVGAEVSTGINGKATIRLGESALVKMKPSSCFRIPGGRDNADGYINLLRLIRGFLFVYAKKGGKNNLKIATPNAICGVRGTRFMVSFEKGRFGMTVGEGEVAFVPYEAGNRVLLVTAGKKISYEPEIAASKKQMEYLESESLGPKSSAPAAPPQDEGQLFDSALDQGQVIEEGSDLGITLSTASKDSLDELFELTESQ